MGSLTEAAPHPMLFDPRPFEVAPPPPKAFDSDWRERAVCAKVASENRIWFHAEYAALPDNPHRGRYYDSNSQRQSSIPRKDRFVEAMAYCAICPVVDECWEYASEEDRHYTVRGGRVPTCNLYEYPDTPSLFARSVYLTRGKRVNPPMKRKP